jgi:hypothetical protein
MTRPVILFRDSIDVSPAEREAMLRYFPVVSSRMDIRPDALVVGRFSVLPFYRELAADLNKVNSTLINSYQQHRYIADLINYAHDLQDYTPETFDVSDLRFITEADVSYYDGYVLKGETNSRKHLWRTHCFAKTKDDIMSVYNRLLDDSLLQHQRIYIRRRARLKTFMEGLHGLPITNEYRTFVAYGQILATGFYWSSHSEEIPERDRTPPPNEFLLDVIDRIGDSAVAYTIDTALREDDTWIVIELNDLQMAGISDCDPDELYARLRKAVP